MKLEDIIHHDVVIKLSTLKTDSELVKQIQTQLSKLGFYPGGAWLDGAYGNRTEQAIVDFCNSVQLNSMSSGEFDRTFAQKLLEQEQEPAPSPENQNSEKTYQKFLKAAASGTIDEPTLLYKRIDTSPYKDQIINYPTHLKRKPDGNNVVSVSKDTAKFQPFPQVGQLPEIDEKGLNFLNKEITEACICVGCFVEGKFKTRWLGRKALSKTEFWSSTKIVPIFNVVSRSNANSPAINIDNCNTVGKDLAGNYRDLPFPDVITDIFTYDKDIATSNSLAAMLKQFSTPLELENWLKSMTGNNDLIFTGRYGEEPFIPQPELWGAASQGISTQRRVILKGASQQHKDDNTITAYDLARMISMLGWHHYIPQSSRFPGAQWHSLESVIRAMGSDAARLTDVALEELGLQDKISSPVIISKLGNGVTKIRNRAEAVYVALVQFVNPIVGRADEFITFSMALKGAKRLEPRDAKREVIELDARMATEVTEIIRRVVAGELV
ncbi:MAG: peptidoglycan-binding domain-containing protein [Cyanobacteriota bacterium]